MNAPSSIGATAESLASGKGHKDENFPVASAIVAPQYRAQVMAFYRFARGADDVADNAQAPVNDKLYRLNAMRDTIIGLADSDPAALALREVQNAHKIDRWHALDLLEAFTRDCTKTRYKSWDDLIDYCRFSAMPVGRYVLDVHGEDRALWAGNDALCAALQVINHLQDCAKDYRAIDRVYLPQDMLDAHGGAIEDLAGARATPGLRAAIVEAAEKTEELLRQSASFSKGIKDRRLAVEVAVIQALAVSLVKRLKTRDPLSERVHHSKAEMLAIAAKAAAKRLVFRR